MAIGLFRNGLVEITVVVKHICKVVQKFGPSLPAAIDRAVTAGRITSTQADQAKAALAAITAACDIFRLASGY